jgi:CheY-like chemotaxis protein
MSAHILIVEDNLANMELAEYLLKARGYSPWKAYDGAQGLSMINERRPDLVVCDLQMPVMDGYELLRVVRGQKITHSLVVVAVTALSMPGDKVRVIAAGFDGYLSKPIEPESFVAQLETYLSPELHARSNVSQG